MYRNEFRQEERDGSRKCLVCCRQSKYLVLNAVGNWRRVGYSRDRLNVDPLFSILSQLLQQYSEQLKDDSSVLMAVQL